MASQAPGDIPFVRDFDKGKSRFAGYWSLWSNSKDLFQDAYDSFTKHGQPCWIPGSSFSKHLALPHTYLPWLAAQPDSVFHHREAFNDLLKSKWSLGGSKYIMEPWSTRLFVAKLRANLDALIQDFCSELPSAVAEQFGEKRTEWTEVTVYGAMKTIFIRAAGRWMVGPTLCQNGEFNRLAVAYMETVFYVSGILHYTPRILHPLVGPVASLRQQYIIAQAKKLVRPVFEDRLQYLSFSSEKDAPKDFLYEAMKHAYTTRREDFNLHDITIYGLYFYWASCHQISLTATFTMFEILKSDAEYATKSRLQEETVRVFGADGPTWSRATAAQCSLMDSTLRESLRLNSFISRHVFKKIMVDGVQAPDGTALPKGALTCVISRPLHTDHELMTEGGRFIPFRFAAAHEIPEGTPTDGAGKKLTAITPDYLPFGYGKHACPGRFLADAQLKMVLTHMLRYYEIELSPKNPCPRPVIHREATLPPRRAMILVRRRAKA
ncbi:cytochrome P450 [Aspergillus heteromorphus CBS 117.55]|uniref:Cytochrome P450 n=1 Tax=Aspergillus heteromorphus CBS 117.55 TaxID=1448321 RepID=A0A317V1S0_9EURO|nr:cytochrome P450 [Aspergillus heteromorphus CBS 117.55]PWY66737.1 cytochrome P450 [Aspergillus heteromorphus CBS 117.55]